MIAVVLENQFALRTLRNRNSQKELTRAIFKIFLCSILCLIAIGCGKSESIEPVLQLGSFSPYVEKFEAYSKQYGNPTTVNNLIIQPGLLNETTLGECTLSSMTTPTITVNTLYWDQLSPTDQTLLLFHEMGHCVLRRAHQNDPDIPTRKWRSIMIAWTQQLTDFEDQKDGYLTELFNPNADSSIGETSGQSASLVLPFPTL